MRPQFVVRDRRAVVGLHDRVRTVAEIVVGRANMYAAWLRNRVVFEGNTRLARSFELVLPGPPGARDPRQDRVRR